MSRLIAAASLLLALTCAIAQSPRYQGSWTGTFQATPTAQLTVDVEFDGNAGKWRAASSNRNNPCLNRDFPVVITNQSDTELTFEVYGSKTLVGCTDATVSLKAVDEKTLDGALNDGRRVRLMRK